MIPRTLQGRLAELAGSFPAVFLTGPRQSGKTTLARATFPDFAYVSLEELHNRQQADEDPLGFLSRLEGCKGAILDEVQKSPQLFSYLQGFLDEGRGGPLVLTGSQHFLLSDRISQSLAGRVAILELLPFSLAELAGREPIPPGGFPETPVGRFPGDGIGLDRVLLSGMYPPIHARRLDPVAWLEGYLATYVERDVRTLSNIGNLDTFTRFLRLCAGRAGQLLNTSSLAADAGVSNDTARRWLSVLRASYVVELLQPHHKNFNKRLVKSPKLYFLDCGLLCRLLGINDTEQLAVHPLRGAVFENFVFTELVKIYRHHGQRPPLFFWRDRTGHEVDFLIDGGTRLVPVEVKAGRTVAGDFLRNLDFFCRLSGEPAGALVYGGDEAYTLRGHRVIPWWSCS
ncbi:MAG: ATP-binding protein [Deltaproteobacteria bacterium]|nr:MAG: ATP-binding protein [Deltaproteobacteria bacterium]